MKYKIFLLLILFLNLSYSQRVVKIVEKTTRVYAHPSLDLFSGIYVYHLDSLYIITPDGRLISGEDELENTPGIYIYISDIFDFFIDTLTSQRIERGSEIIDKLVKYKIEERAKIIFWDSSYHLNTPGPLDPVNKILLKKETNWILKKFHWEDNYTIKEDSTIGIIDIEESGVATRMAREFEILDII